MLSDKHGTQVSKVKVALLATVAACILLGVVGSVAKCSDSRHSLLSMRVFEPGLLGPLQRMPIGAVVPYFGAAEAIPDGWAICNGASVKMPVISGDARVAGAMQKLPDCVGMRVLIGRSGLPEGPIEFAWFVPGEDAMPSWKQIHWIIRVL